jgi:hypothetical protein
VRVLYYNGAHVVLPVRNMEKAKEVQAMLNEDVPINPETEKPEGSVRLVHMGVDVSRHAHNYVRVVQLIICWPYLCLKQMM